MGLFSGKKYSWQDIPRPYPGQISAWLTKVEKEWDGPMQQKAARIRSNLKDSVFNGKEKTLSKKDLKDLIGIIDTLSRELVPKDSSGETLATHDRSMRHLAETKAFLERFLAGK